MAVKTITIDLEAYESLARRKRQGQSFSQVIKEHFGTQRTGHDLKRALASIRISPSTLDAIEQLVEARAGEPASGPEL